MDLYVPYSITTFSTETDIELLNFSLPNNLHKLYTDHYMVNKKGYVSLFSGSGVGCHGFSTEGYDCIVTSEIIPRRLEIQKFNDVCSLDDGYVVGDIADPHIQNQILRLIKNWQKTYKQSDIDVIIATPPCQGISVANHKKKNEQVRNSLVIESLKIIKEVEPRHFVLENVRGFLNTVCTDIDGKSKSIQEAIKLNLGGMYNIGFKALNFKDYGSNSSRTRTLVIGVRKDIEEVTPYDLFPSKKEAPTLRELISDLPRLKFMGEIDPNDIYHSFRPYDQRMMAWIKDLKEGESAFDNKDPQKIPHSIIKGKIVPNQNKNHDKYKRCYWDNVAPCVHTRNDILASQNTIHPEDHRVFSIRELMRFMSMPSSYKWSDRSLTELNKLSDVDKALFLKKNEMNIRQCLGEGVPTQVYSSVAKNIGTSDSREAFSLNKIKRLIDKNNLTKTNELIDYLSSSTHDFVVSNKIAELANAKRLDDAAYYTRQDLCFNLAADLPDFKSKKTIRILEPSVGVGNFLPSIIGKYQDKEHVHLDLVDISAKSIQILKRVLKTIKIPKNFEIRIINDDFLTHNFRNTYDLVVGNPPFGKIGSEKFSEYERMGLISSLKTRNIFALFFEKALAISDTVALFSPKSLLNAPEFKYLRALLAEHAVIKISDYGEKGFNGVKIETISLQVKKSGLKNKTIIDSYILRSYMIHDQEYITDNHFPYWLIYRDQYFDQMIQKLELGLFTVIRDRSLTSKSMKKHGKVRVIKSRNIRNGKITQLQEDQYIDNISESPIAEKYFNKKGIIIAPNLTYYPRATFLPRNTIVDGSAALLMPKKKIIISTKDLEFFASKEYFLFYRIARNYATRSLNIDSNSVYFWGIPKKEIPYEIFDEPNKSSYLFLTPARYLADAI